MSDKISDSGEFLGDIVSSSADDPMAALHAAIKHRDNCKLEQCALCDIFRKHALKRRQETWGWGRGSRVDETVNISALVSGEAGEERRFEYTSHHDGMLWVMKTAMSVTLLATGHQDGDAVTIFDWATGPRSLVRPQPGLRTLMDPQRLESKPATFFASNPLGSGNDLAKLQKGDRLAFSARFREAATLSVSFWGQFRPARKAVEGGQT